VDIITDFILLPILRRANRNLPAYYRLCFVYSCYR